MITEITALTWWSWGLAVLILFYYMTKFVIITIYHVVDYIKLRRIVRRYQYLNREHTTFEKLTPDGEFSLDLNHPGNRKRIMNEINKFKGL